MPLNFSFALARVRLDQGRRRQHFISDCSARVAKGREILRLCLAATSFMDSRLQSNPTANVWSSTENSSNNARNLNFNNGSWNNNNKNNENWVVPVRK